MPYRDAKKDQFWRKQNTIRVTMVFSRLSDDDMSLYKWLKSQPSMQGAIKDMIRQKIASDKPLGGN